MKRVLDKLVSLGATIVIVGAWAKITHKSFADTALTVGLLTEAAIFIMYMFIPEESNTHVSNGANKSDEKIDRIIKAFKSI